MPNPDLYNFNAIKARLAELSFKASAQGLSPAEAQEMAQLRAQLQMAQASNG